ncbi:phosphodiesterase [Candidatus Poribacteria bacterium]|nr:phosphodiesterase [Candidatus Poribacteria bacterium]
MATVSSVLSASLVANTIGWSKDMSQNGSFNKVIVLGIDGLDPKIMEKLMEGGELPNFSKLRETGSYRRLMSVNPSQSPVVWSSIATGSNPGYHGIFDFIIRNPQNYLPELSLTKINPRNRKPLASVSLANITGSHNSMFLHARQGNAFWHVTSENGVPTTVVRWPVTFPAEKISGRMLSGLGVPDIKGNLGRYAFYTTKKVSGQKKGEIVKVSFNENKTETQITGPTVAKIGRATESEIPITIHIERAKSKITISIGDRDYEVQEGGWSAWIHLNFDVGMRRNIAGICRFYLTKIQPDFELYMTPIQVSPESPIFPISHPDEYAPQLAQNIGTYHTLGYPEDTNALGDDIFTADVFIENCDAVMQEREKMLWAEMQNFKDGVFAFVFDTTDRIQHMFWNTRDPKHPTYDETYAQKYYHVIEDYYRRLDGILRKLLEYVDEKTALLILSDHGFATFRRVVHLNSWLVENGLMTLKHPPTDAEGDPLFQNVNWDKTKAYALGFSSIYLNLSGREGQGTVRKASEANKVKGQITKELEKLKDSATGELVVQKVYDGEKLYKGPYADEAPDLVVGFYPGYRFSWQTAIGGAPASLIEDNLKKWSGDHLLDPQNVEGILFMNNKVGNQHPTVLDIAPTVLKCCGISLPKEMEGKTLI